MLQEGNQVVTLVEIDSFPAGCKGEVTSVLDDGKVGVNLTHDENGVSLGGFPLGPQPQSKFRKIP